VNAQTLANPGGSILISTPPSAITGFSNYVVTAKVVLSNLPADSIVLCDLKDAANPAGFALDDARVLSPGNASTPGGGAYVTVNLTGTTSVATPQLIVTCNANPAPNVTAMDTKLTVVGAGNLTVQRF
jgi:hypothetical protein